MKRTSPIFSSLGLVFTAMLLLGLGLVLWRTGGMAFSPGRLSAKSVSGIALNGFVSHSEFESQCSLCHAPFETTQDQLCMDCHKDITRQIESAQGTHGQLANVNQCARCHSEHQGPGFDPLTPALGQFDHATTHFSLLWHQVNYDKTTMNCDACHTIDQKFHLDQGKCETCHQDHDQAFMSQHVQDFGNQCTDCHDGQDRMTDFDHASTDFPLDGQHVALRCGECHQIGDAKLGAQNPAGSDQVFEATFKNTPVECIACHDEPKIHAGMFDANCENCHTTSGWLPAIWDGKAFDHTRTTGFSLARHTQKADSSQFVCKDCHQGDVSQFDLKVCINCHAQGEQNAAFMLDHQAQFGPACLDCHDGVDRMSNFDHANFFPLNGAHAVLECEQCHEDKVFRSTPQQCVDCHAEPEIHAGFFGVQCQNCHTDVAWAPARMTVHNFPLDHGGQGTVQCETCHISTYVEYTCYGCHDHQPDEIQASHLEAAVTLEELPNCTKCHPTGLKQEPHDP